MHFRPRVSGRQSIVYKDPPFGPVVEANQTILNVDVFSIFIDNEIHQPSFSLSDSPSLSFAHFVDG
jgi:hypothetical protein